MHVMHRNPDRLSSVPIESRCGNIWADMGLPALVLFPHCSIPRRDPRNTLWMRPLMYKRTLQVWHARDRILPPHVSASINTVVFEHNIQVAEDASRIHVEWSVRLAQAKRIE
jgi:hypothetical protein